MPASLGAQKSRLRHGKHAAFCFFGPISYRRDNGKRLLSGGRNIAAYFSRLSTQARKDPAVPSRNLEATFRGAAASLLDTIFV